MGGSEAHWQEIQSSGITQAQADAFAATGAQGAAQLVGSGFYGGQGKLLNSKQQDISSIYEAFNAWKSKNENTDRAHAMYVGAYEGAKGRSGNILVPEKPLTPTDPTILGGAPTKGKTLLGG